MNEVATKASRNVSSRTTQTIHVMPVTQEKHGTHPATVHYTSPTTSRRGSLERS